MSGERLDRLERRLGILKWVVALGWALLAGAFGIGAWVAKLEIEHREMSRTLLQHDGSIHSNTAEINNLRVSESRVSTDIASIKTTLERIEKKL